MSAEGPPSLGSQHHRTEVAESYGEDIEAFWALSVEETLSLVHSDRGGLSTQEAQRRRNRFGPNRLAPPRRLKGLALLGRRFTDPIVLILLAATALSFIVGDVIDALIILSIVVLSALLGFWQEHRAAIAVERLLMMVKLHADVMRDGQLREIPPEDLVRGDLVLLNAGDIIPCDCRVISADDLQVDEAALTGESYPRHKQADAASRGAAMSERHSAVFSGSHVVSGRGEALVVATGALTQLGRLSLRVEAAAPRTGFEQGITKFGLLLARVTAVLTAVIFVVNLLLERPFIDALLFSLALAVGLTPQLLPAIVSVSLATGAHRMARRKVIVRRLDAIEDFGSMNVLCTDKTGTLTEGSVHLHASIDAHGDVSSDVASAAALNAGLQTGFTNPIDAAILKEHSPDAKVRALDEVPFDFSRKRLSVLVEGRDGRWLVTKGAFNSVLDVCTSVLTRHGVVPLIELGESLATRYRELSKQGMRVLGVARKPMPWTNEALVSDEHELTFLGFLTFLDPPKRGVGQALQDLVESGIRLCMVTGDNRHAAAHLAESIGMETDRLLTGADIDLLTDDELARAASAADVFAEINPLQKERVIRSLHEAGSIVGYLGDGINDAGALHLSDVGITVDTAVDVAKSAAAIVLLDKDLEVLIEGVRVGRQTFANTLKYVFTTVSANFGNMASLAVASVFLRFLPLLPRQILLLNFLSDIPSMAIALDNVDLEERERPRSWDVRFIRNFMIVFGLLSSAFDLLTFTVLLQVFHASPSLFRSGWFVGSTITELAVLLVLRTRRTAFQSRPARGLLATSLVVGLVTILLPYASKLAQPLGLIPLPAKVLGTLFAITGVYVAFAELIKPRFYRGVKGTARSAAEHTTDSGN